MDPAVDRTGTPYAFTGGDPINESDPSGLIPVDEGGSLDPQIYRDPGSWTYAQSSYSEEFQSKGTFAGQTINDVGGQLESGALTPGEIPVTVYRQSGYTYILNTRSAMALTRAGIPRSQWFINDVTGSAKFRKTLNWRLQQDNLGEAGCSQPWSRSNPDFEFSSAADYPDFPDATAATAGETGADAAGPSAIDGAIELLEELGDL